MEIPDDCKGCSHTGLSCSGIWKEERVDYISKSLIDKNHCWISENINKQKQWMLHGTHLASHQGQLAVSSGQLSYHLNGAWSFHAPQCSVLAEKECHSHPLTFTPPWTVAWKLSTANVEPRSCLIFLSFPFHFPRAPDSTGKSSTGKLLPSLTCREHCTQQWKATWPASVLFLCSITNQYNRTEQRIDPYILQTEILVMKSSNKKLDWQL